MDVRIIRSEQYPAGVVIKSISNQEAIGGRRSIIFDGLEHMHGFAFRECLPRVLKCELFT